MNTFTLVGKELKGEVVKTGYRIWDLGLIFKLINVYFKTFSDSYKTCAQIQTCYTPLKLFLAFFDKEYFKVVVFWDGQPIGFCLLTNNLEKASITYMDPRYYRHKYSEYTAAGKLYYVTAICVLPEMQKDGHGLELLASVISFIDKGESMVAFDFSHSKNKNLPKYIIFAAESKNDLAIELGQCDSQEFVILYGPHHKVPS